MYRSETESESTLGLPLSAAERKLLDNLPVLNENVVAVVQQTLKKTVRLSVAQMDELADALSLNANQTEDRVRQRKLDTLVRKIDRLTSSHLLSLLEAETPGAKSAGSLRPK
jgi:hypothetical protein